MHKFMTTPTQHSPVAPIAESLRGVLQAIRQGQSGTAAVEAVTPSLRPGVQALSFAVLRSLGRAQALRDLLAPRTPLFAGGCLVVHRTGVAVAARRTRPTTPLPWSIKRSRPPRKRRNSKRRLAFINACLRRFSA